MLEGPLLEKLWKIEALHAGATVAGEREAARRAAERVRARLLELRGREEEIEKGLAGFLEKRFTPSLLATKVAAFLPRKD